MTQQQEVTVGKVMAWVGAVVMIVLALFFHRMASRKADGSPRRRR